MNVSTPTWDDVRRIVDELDLQIHLAGMEARERWRELQPKLAEIEKAIVHPAMRASETVGRELASMAAALQRLREDVRAHRH